MKAVLISIKPEWCEKILSGKKTIEIRKTKPKLEVPFKCYIYCTKPKQRVQHTGHCYGFEDELYRLPTDEIKYGDSIELMCYDEIDGTNFLNGKVIAESVCDSITELAPLNHSPDKVEEMACLSREQIVRYCKGRGYAWHISDLKVYDKPKELHDFKKPRESRCLLELKKDADCLDCKHWNFEGEYCTERFTSQVSRPPQSWGYVEELEVDK